MKHSEKSDQGNHVRLRGRVGDIADGMMGLGTCMGLPRFLLVEAFKKSASSAADYPVHEVQEFEATLSEYLQQWDGEPVEKRDQVAHVLAGMLLFAKSLWQNFDSER